MWMLISTGWTKPLLLRNQICLVFLISFLCLLFLLSFLFVVSFFLYFPSFLSFRFLSFGLSFVWLLDPTLFQMFVIGSSWVTKQQMHVAGSFPFPFFSFYLSFPFSFLFLVRLLDPTNVCDRVGLCYKAANARRGFFVISRLTNDPWARTGVAPSAEKPVQNTNTNTNTNTNLEIEKLPVENRGKQTITEWERRKYRETGEIRRKRWKWASKTKKWAKGPWKKSGF